HPKAAMSCVSVAPPGRFIMAIAWSVLLPSRATLGLFSPVGAFFVRVVFLVAVGVVGATLAACAPTLATGSSNGVVWCAASTGVTLGSCVGLLAAGWESDCWSAATSEGSLMAGGATHS